MFIFMNFVASFGGGFWLRFARTNSVIMLGPFGDLFAHFVSDVGKL